MSPNEKAIATFETRVRQMLLRFQELKKENEELYAIIGQNESDIKQLKAQLAQADSDYNALKMARMLTITDGDLDGAKARVQKLIRDVNKCIAILSDEQQ